MGLNVKKVLAIGAAAFLTLTISAQAEHLVLTGPDVAADTMIRKASPDENFDHRYDQVIIQKGYDKYLLQFDLAALPKGSTIHSAVLELTVNRVWKGGVVSARRVAESWTETGVTWNTRDGQSPWGIPGGTADSTNAARVDVQAAGRVSFDVRRIVQEWAGGSANNGFLVDMEDATGWAQIACRESEYWTAEERPRLTIEYSLPEVVLTGPESVADTMLRKAAPDENFDHRFDQMIIQKNWDRCVFRFDLSGVPAGSTVYSARLELTVNKVWTGGVVKAARVLEPWSEVFATWNSRNGEHDWLVAGGTSEPSSAVELSIQEAGRVSWDVGEIVQQWVDGAPNHGFHVYMDDGAGWAQIAVLESEHWVPSEGPALIVQYAPPAANPTVSLSGPEHTEDTMIRLQWPDENFDARFEQVIVQRNWDKYLLRFDLSGIPQNAVIDEATLYFTVNNVWTGGDTYIRQVLTPWVEAEATWNSAASGRPWGEGGLRPGEDYIGEPLYTLGIYSPGQYFVSLRDVAQRWVTGLDGNCGLLIDMGQGQAWWQAALRESEYAVEADRPRLDITYHEGPPIDTKKIEIRTAAQSIVSPAQLEGAVGFGAEIVRVDIEYGECHPPAWGTRFLHTADVGRPWFMGLLDDLATRPEQFDAVRLSKTTWYADNQSARGGPIGVALHPCQPTDVKVWTEADEKSVSIEWVPTDLTGKYFGSDRVVIRKGDSLLLTANDNLPAAAKPKAAQAGGSRLEIDADGDGEYEAWGKPGAFFVNRYTVPGVYTVRARIGKDEVGSLSVVVVDVMLPERLASQIGFKREWEATLTPSVADGDDLRPLITFGSADPDMMTTNLVSLIPDGFRLNLTVLRTGAPTILSRLGPGGPIISMREVSEYTLEASATYHVVCVPEGEDGGAVGTATVTLSPLVPDLQLVFTMNSPGVTFDGGVVEMVVKTAEFSEDGTYEYKLHYAPGVTFMCHDIAIFDNPNGEEQHGGQSNINGIKVRDIKEELKQLANESLVAAQGEIEAGLDQEIRLGFSLLNEQYTGEPLSGEQTQLLSDQLLTFTLSMAIDSISDGQSAQSQAIEAMGEMLVPYEATLFTLTEPVQTSGVDWDFWVGPGGGWIGALDNIFAGDWSGAFETVNVDVDVTWTGDLGGNEVATALSLDLLINTTNGTVTSSISWSFSMSW